MIETERLRLIPISVELVESLVREDRAAAEAALDAVLAALGLPGGTTLPEAWPDADLVTRAFPYSLDAIRADPTIRLWGDSVVIPRYGQPRVLGSIVFHGKPDDGIAEVSYGIEASSRGNGFATEATLASVEWALAQPHVASVRATTFPWHHASLRVIHKLGMVRCGERVHDLLGELLVFERRRKSSPG